MDMEQFEMKLTLAGYNEQQIAEAKELIQKYTMEVVAKIFDAIKQLAESLVDAFGGAFNTVKEAFEEFKKLAEASLNEQSPDTRHLTFNKRMAYVNKNKFVMNLVRRLNIRDIRSMNMSFTRCRRKC